MDADAWRQAKAVLADVLTRPPDERGAFLLARCPDPALRREVESYLHQYDAEFLETVITASGAFDRPDALDEPPELPPGTRVGPYIVLDRLGVGGMGHVFLGTDTRLRRRVALKCLIASPAAGDLREKLLHEARAAARINHPNIAIVHDVVEHDGRSILVMEYVEGDSLASVLRRGRLPLDRILAIGRQLASALTAAHAKGIIHRDLKPANIHVTSDGSVKVLDFGVAQAISLATASTAGTTTMRGDKNAPQPGTPAYMSPEQLLGRPVDQRSDIYSLGVILYEMATGHRPYSASDPLDLLTALGNRLLNPHSVDPNVPRDVSDAIAKALEVNANNRYQTAAEFEAELAALAKVHEGETAQPIRGAANVSLIRRIVRAAGIVISVPLGVGLIGFLTTAAFNLELGRTAPFDTESAGTWFDIGRRSLFTPALVIAGTLIVLWSGSFAVRVLSLSNRIDRLLTTSRTRTRRLSARLGLDDPTILGQAVALIGGVGIAVVMWLFRDLIVAFLTILPVYPDIHQRLLPLGPSGSSSRMLYRIVFDVLILAFSAATIRIVQLRAREPVPRGGGALTLVASMLALTILLSQLPYRIMFGNQFERIDYAGERCYVIGEHEDESLIYCPDKSPPRNRRITRDDPAVRKLGIVESIFTPPETSH